MMLRVPLEWLSEYVAIRMTPEALAHRLTMAGLTVEGVETAGGAPVFVLEITPNRADCLSIVGVAREVAVCTGQKFRGAGHGTWDMGHGKTKPRHTSHVTRPIIRIEDRTGCRRYIGRLIDGVIVTPSPEWMQRRLTACGLRPINNIVDITNYILLECGQPLHAFDCARLTQQTILVRRAKAGESIRTLDGEMRKLSAEQLVIAEYDEYCMPHPLQPPA